jgi:hypothetical protein
MNDILLVAAIVALSGAVLGFVLIRGKDFVVSHAQGAAPPEAEPELAPLP